MISRSLQFSIQSHLAGTKKVIVLYGARQIGKTTMLKNLMSEFRGKSLWVNGDLAEYQEVLSSKSKASLQALIDDNELVIIDEAQNIPSIGENLKILYDEFPNVRVIATGSSSLELAGKTKESLAGRAITLQMHPIAIQELRKDFSLFDLKTNLHDYIIYGLYPEIVTATGADTKKNLLKELVSSYLYRDILQLSNIKNSDKIYKLLQLLAYQVGQLVSIHELAKSLSLNHETVGNYLDLLEKSFVIFSLSGLSRNPRKEISKMDKYYFVDTGVRNSLINDFNTLDIRNDKGELWENFFINERRKYLDYNNHIVQRYFWRRYSGAELDWVELQDDHFHVFEIKWNKTRKNPPASWVTDYPNHDFHSITQDNFWEYVM